MEDEDHTPEGRIRALTDLHAQMDVLRAILRDVEGRGLVPEEERTVAELTAAFAELAEAVRTLFGE